MKIHVYVKGFGIGIIKECKDPNKVRVQVGNLDIIYPFETKDILDLPKKEIIQKILTQKNEVAIANTWNKRYKEWLQLLKEGDLQDIAKIYSQLLEFSKKKDLSFGERKMKDQCENILKNFWEVA